MGGGSVTATNITMSGGMIGGNGTLTTKNGFTHNGGTLNLTSSKPGTLTLQGNYIQNGGVISINLFKKIKHQIFLVSQDPSHPQMD